MSTAPATFERLQEMCSQRGCGVQDLFLIGNRPYMTIGNNNARNYPREHQPFLVGDPQLARALPDLLRQLGAIVYESLDELREHNAQGEEFSALYDALYDSLVEYGGGVAPDGEPLYLPGGYQGVAEIQLHIQSRALLVPTLIQRLQSPLSKYQRKWKIRVTTGGVSDTSSIAEILADAVHAC